MGKRTHSEFVSNGEGVSSSKRLKMTHALSLLSDHSDELIDCLKALKHQEAGAGSSSYPDAALSAQLAGLSQKLLPAFKALAKNDHTQDSKREPEPEPEPEPAIKREVPLLTHKREVPLLTQWNATEIAKEMPPLPKILNPVYEKAAFTHAGQSVRRGDLNYERLEWIGDAYLYLIATSFIYQTFKDRTPGQCTQLRELLVKNMTLKDYSLHYRFQERLDFPAEFSLEGRPGGTKATDKECVKVMGDIFEAYVGAVILSDPINGVSRASEWLKAVWSMTISKEIKMEAKKTIQPAHVLPVTGTEPTASSVPSATLAINADMPAKNRLNTEIMAPGIKIEYRDLGSHKDPSTKQTLFVQGCYLIGYGNNAGVQLSTGTAPKKVAAGHQAAENALKNKKLIKVYKEKKRVYLEERKAQEAVKELDG